MELVAKKRIEFKSAVAGGKPGYGAIGRKTQVFVNHFPVTLPEKGIIYHYDIELEEQIEDLAGPTADKPGGKKNAPVSPKQTSRPKLGAAGDAAEIGNAMNRAKQKEAARIPKRLKRDIISYWQTQNGDFFANGVLGVYDGEKNFFTFKKLPLVQAEEKDFNVKVPADAEEGRRAKVFTLTVKLANQISVDVLHRAISDPGREFPTNVLVAFQCVMREALSRWCPAPGLRTFFFPENGFDLSSDRSWSPKQAWPGIFISLRPNLWKVTLNLDVSHTALSKEQPFLEYYAKYIKNATKRYNFEGTDVTKPDQHASLADHHRKAAEREVYGLKVQSSYSGIRRWRCSGFSAKPLKDLDFTLADGKTKQKVVDYFHLKYKINLQHVHLPAVQVGPKKNPKYLPMTHCSIIGGQKMGRKLAEEEVSAMVKSCARPAYERKRQIENIRTSPITTITKERKNPFEQRDNPFLKEFGISVADKMPLAPARVLPVPIVGGKALYNVKSDEATLDIPRDAKFVPYKGVPLTHEWALINLSRERRLDKQALDKVISLLCNMGRDRMGTFPQPKNAAYAVDQINSRDFVKYYEHLKKSIFQGKRPQLLVIIVPKKGCSEYATCKQYFDVVEGVKTQMIAADSLSKNLERGLSMYISNLLLKINAKLNGSNQLVAFPKLTPQIQNLPGLKQLLSKPTMMFGADVTHPSVGMSAVTPSIAAVTASVDKLFGEYRARVRAQVHREEIIQDMEQIALELFDEFKKIHKCYPHHIVFFRDGVSEGQMNHVWTNEVNALQNACKKIGGEKIGKPGITYVIVGKRHHTRLFAQSPKEAVGRAGNVPPGTIVDSGICHYAELDYYLCSHFGIQGTSRPAHYHVLCDDNDLDVDSLQLLSYYLCYVYQRCLRAVSVPAPAYYAHHVAFRARHHLSRVFSDFDSSDSSSALATPERRAQMQTQLAAYNREILLHGDVLNTQYFC